MAKATSNTSNSSSDVNLGGLVWFGVAAYVFLLIFSASYNIRMSAINDFGAVIHEFDPYFNFRATEVSPLFFFNAVLSFLLLCSNLSHAFFVSPMTDFDCSTFMNMEPKSFFSGLIQWCGIRWEDL